MMKPFPIIITGSILPLLAAGQEEGDIRDVKELIEIPTPPNYWLWAIIIVVILLVGFAIWKWLQKTNTPPGVSAAKRALKELQKAERLVSRESADPLVIQTTGAIRQYIENRFNLAATRQTTEEFLGELHHVRDHEITRFQDELGKFLRSCDTVKFGQAELKKTGRKALLQNARKFVEATKDVPQAEQPPTKIWNLKRKRLPQK